MKIDSDVLHAKERQEEPCDTKYAMIVDDHESIVELFRLVLAEEFPEASIQAAYDGEQALDYFQKVHHALVLMDLQMPKLDGMSCFEKLEKICDGRGWEMPSVIFCTAYRAPRRLKTLISENARHCFLSKPVGVDSLLLAVGSRWNTRHLRVKATDSRQEQTPQSSR